MPTPYLLLAIFGAVVAGVWAVLSAFGEKESRASERLQELRDGKRRDPSEAAGMGQMLVKAAPGLSEAFQPKTLAETNQLKLRMANAGYSSPLAPQAFLIVKAICTIAGIIISGGGGAYKYGLNSDILLPMVVGAGVGMFLPNIVLSFQISGRQKRIFLSTPDALDLLVVCVEAGLGLDAAMRRVSDELEETSPDLCMEMKSCNQQLQIGRPRREALHDLGQRCGVDDLRQLTAILIQAEKFGTPIGQALRVQSETMRRKRSQMAEEKAAQSAVKILFPLVLFIFPGIFVVLVGPAAISMIRQLLSTSGAG